MKKILYLSFMFLSAGIMSSCAGNETEKHDENTSHDSAGHHSETKIPVEPTMIADLGISGMVCEMNCVGSVKKTLLGMNGVESMDIEFDPDLDVNHAFVKFDDKIISKEEMISAIEKLNDKQYKVESSEVNPVAETVPVIEEEKKKTSSAEKSEAGKETSHNVEDINVTGIFNVLVNVL